MDTVHQKNKSNFNQAFWLGIGQLLTFALSFVSAAILSRYFNKTEYGTYRQILYVYNTLHLLFTMGLPSVFAYFIPRLNQGQQKQLIKKLNKVFLYLGFCFSISLFFLSKPISIWLNNPSLELGIKIFSPFPIFTLPAMGVEGIYTAIRRTKDIAYYHILSKVLMLLFIVCPVIIFNTSYIGAIIGWGTASFITFLFAMYLKNKPYTKVEPELVPNMYKMILDYSMPLMGAFVFGFVINSADQFFVSHYYGTEMFAIYSNGCFSIPIVSMVATSVKNILLPLFSKANAECRFSEIITTYNNAVYESIKLIFPILIFCMFFSAQITTLIYGPKYTSSGSFLQIYILRDFIDVFPYLSVLLALGKSRFYMWSHLFGAIYVWTLDYVIVTYDLQPVFIVLIATSLQYLIRISSFAYIKKISGINLFEWKSIKRIIFLLMHTMCCIYPIFIILKNYSSLNNFLLLLVGGASYYILLIFSGEFFKIDYLSSLKMLKRNK